MKDLNNQKKKKKAVVSGSVLIVMAGYCGFVSHCWVVSLPGFLSQIDFILFIRWNTKDIINNVMFLHITTIVIEKYGIDLLLVSHLQLFLFLSKASHSLLKLQLQPRLGPCMPWFFRLFSTVRKDESIISLDADLDYSLSQKFKKNK